MGSDRKAPAPEPSAQAVAGWQMVPVKPTEDMLWRGHMKIDFDRSGQNTYELEHESQEGSTIRTDMLDAWAAMLASAPSTPPPAMVGAVPMESWPIERAADMLTAYAEMVKATGRYAEKHYIPEIENVAAELRGIAPKAAQPVEGER